MILYNIGIVCKTRYSEDGQVWTDAARKLGLTRARITQILNMTLLAPDIQEEVLFMERVDGVEPKLERRIREVLRCEDWGEQRGDSHDL